MKFLPILLIFITLHSCKEEPLDDPQSDDKSLIMLMNHTGHNSPNRYCGNELKVVFHLTSPRERLEVPMDPDFRQLVGLDIEVGEFITVSAYDETGKQLFAETSGQFTGPRTTANGNELYPAIRLCPKDLLEFIYF